ncbi:GDP-D-glucose phosphorylase 1 [Pogona vitticeps]
MASGPSATSASRAPGGPPPCFNRPETSPSPGNPSRGWPRPPLPQRAGPSPRVPPLLGGGAPCREGSTWISPSAAREERRLESRERARVRPVATAAVCAQPGLSSGPDPCQRARPPRTRPAPNLRQPAFIMAMELATPGQDLLSPAPQPPEVFAYEEEDFALQGVEWPAGHHLSPFDRVLQSGWEDRMKRGLFRYPLGDLQTRILPGTVGFVAQLNIQRGVERRRPQEIRSLQQPFDPQQFNFNQIQPAEMLFYMRRGGPPCLGRAPSPAGPACISVVINVSPLEFGHVLLVPSPALSLPQVLTPEALRFGLDAVLLSAHPGFRIGFNSLGAFASVNHLHLHGFYLNWELLVETAPCVPLLPEASLYRLQEVPAPGFVFYSEGQQLEKLTRYVVQVTDYLVKKEIAHNLFITRGARPEGPIHSEARPGIRIIVWPRRACFGAKEESAFNVALCELAGHLPIKTAQDFKDLTEASAIQIIQKYLLSNGQFARLQSDLVSLLKG